ncbi:hypothetical protein M9458_002505, partial [Cirrhinus mrigala]
MTEEPTDNMRAEERIMNIRQAERPLDYYVEEFLSFCHLVSWSDAMINMCFLMGLNDDKLFCSITPEDRCKPVAELINYVLALSHSNFYVDVEDSNPPPIGKHASTPAHHQPASSTCYSNELAPSSPPSLYPVLHSSSLILSPEPTADSRTPSAASSRIPAAPAASSRTPPVASSRTPTTPPRSGLVTGNMASHIYIKDLMDLHGLISPLFPLVPSRSPPSPLVPSSSPKPPLIPSIPPEPELPPARPPAPERPPKPVLPPAPPEHPPEPVPPPAPPERPPELAPPECPPEPAPPNHPPVSAPPERPPEPAYPKPSLPVLSGAKDTLSFPKKLLEATPLISHGLLDCVLGHGLMDCVLGHGLPNSLTRHGLMDC